MAPDPNTAAVASASAPPFARDFFYRSHDGLRLHVRDFGDPAWPRVPVVCLPGLTRSARDFEELGRHLASHPARPRRVAAFDYRGRGQSDRDPSPDGYRPLVEMTDVLDGMAALNIPQAVVVGTSRGGIIAMLMAVARPAVLAGVVLNDIGPVMEATGLARIKAYIGRMPPPDDWSDAVAILKRVHGAQFTGLDAAGWDHYARTTWRDAGGKPASDVDPALAHALDGIDFDRPIPALWDQFNALRGVPVFAIRGGNSDLLSAETVAAMAATHPRFAAETVAGEGHPPQLRGTLNERIAAYVATIEGDADRTPVSLPAFDLDAESGPA